MADRVVLIFKPATVLVSQIELWAASGAGRRCGLKSAVTWAFVFGLARRAHRELTHRRLRAVIRRVLDDRETRPAVDAIDKRIAVAPVSRVEQFSQAIGASCDVGREGNELSPGGFALDDAEFEVVGERQVVAALEIGRAHV